MINQSLNGAPKTALDNKISSWERRFPNAIGFLHDLALNLREPFLNVPDEDETVRQERIKTAPREMTEKIGHHTELLDCIRNENLGFLASTSEKYRVTFSYDKDAQTLKAEINNSSIPAPLKPKSQSPAMAAA